jgi:hypothetical protein
MLSVKKRTNKRRHGRLAFAFLVAGNTAAQTAGIAAGYDRVPTLWQDACLTFTALVATVLGAATLGPDALGVETMRLLKNSVLRGLL